MMLQLCFFPTVNRHLVGSNLQFSTLFYRPFPECHIGAQKTTNTCFPEFLLRYLAPKIALTPSGEMTRPVYFMFLGGTLALTMTTARTYGKPSLSRAFIRNECSNTNLPKNGHVIL